MGCLVGVAVALGVELYRRSAQLTEVRLVVLGNEMSFTAKTDMRQAAQRLFFQAATRVATRPLEDGSGNLREALTSLKALFDLYREPLEGHATPPPPARGDSVYELALDILNFELAPFLSKWHPRRLTNEHLRPFLATWHPALQEYAATRPQGVSAVEHERRWERSADMRADLAALRAPLTSVAKDLATLCGIDLLTTPPPPG